MWKFIVLIAAGFLLFRMFDNDQKKKKKAAEKEQAKQAACGDLVQDPVCGAYVSPAGEFRVKSGEQVHSFCSYECRDKYLKEIGAKPEVAEAAKEGKTADDA